MSKPDKNTASNAAKKKVKSGLVRKQTHLSSQTKRNQAKRDSKGSN